MRSTVWLSNQTLSKYRGFKIHDTKSKAQNKHTPALRLPEEGGVGQNLFQTEQYKYRQLNKTIYMDQPLVVYLGSYHIFLRSEMVHDLGIGITQLPCHFLVIIY
jgi:hypothetical protein